MQQNDVATLNGPPTRSHNFPPVGFNVPHHNFLDPTLLGRNDCVAVVRTARWPEKDWDFLVVWDLLLRCNRVLLYIIVVLLVIFGC